MFVPPGLAFNFYSYLKDCAEKIQSVDYHRDVIEFNRAIELYLENAGSYQYRGVAKARYGIFGFNY